MSLRDLFQTSAPDVAVEIDHTHVAAARLSWRGNQAVISAHANEELPPGLVVPDGMVVMGLPGKIVRPTNDKEKQYLADIPPRYVEVARMHCERPGDVLVKPWGA